MSPLPTSRASEGLAIGLCPDTVGIARLGGWRYARVSGHELIDVAEPTTDGLAAVAALDHWLGQTRPSPTKLGRWRKAPARVVLSDRLVRYARIPWSGGALSRQEEATLTLACFEERYGDMSGWTLRSEPGRYGQNRLAGAVPAALIDALQGVLRTHRMVCEGVSPYFTVCWNRWRRDIAKQSGSTDALFAVADFGTVVIGVFNGADGDWRTLRSLRAATSEGDLAQVLAREAVLHSLPEQPATWVHSPQPGVFGPPTGNLHVLTAPATWPAPIVMAMSGVGR